MRKTGILALGLLGVAGLLYGKLTGQFTLSWWFITFPLWGPPVAITVVVGGVLILSVLWQFIKIIDRRRPTDGRGS